MTRNIIQLMMSSEFVRSVERPGGFLNYWGNTNKRVSNRTFKALRDRGLIEVLRERTDKNSLRTVVYTFSSEGRKWLDQQRNNMRGAE
jgi:hypothetical protein